ncbi:MAG: hypothetical protein KGQ41_01100 [Alphaproteobacteria bacterium]|nr:hypothetical protein [Alphaproteobacteria bacterium]
MRIGVYSPDTLTEMDRDDLLEAASNNIISGIETTPHEISRLDSARTLQQQQSELDGFDAIVIALNQNERHTTPELAASIRAFKLDNPTKKVVLYYGIPARDEAVRIKTSKAFNAMAGDVDFAYADIPDYNSRLIGADRPAQPAPQRGLIKMPPRQSRTAAQAPTTPEEPTRQPKELTVEQIKRRMAAAPKPRQPLYYFFAATAKGHVANLRSPELLTPQEADTLDIAGIKVSKSAKTIMKPDGQLLETDSLKAQQHAQILWALLAYKGAYLSEEKNRVLFGLGEMSVPVINNKISELDKLLQKEGLGRIRHLTNTGYYIDERDFRPATGSLPKPPQGPGRRGMV